jgi:hypothetical protein
MANGFVTPPPPVDFDPGFVQAPPATAPEQTQTFGTSFTEKPQFFGTAGTPTGGFAGSLAPFGPGRSAASTVPSIGVSDVDSDVNLGGIAAAGAGLAGLGALVGSLGQEENGGVGSIAENIMSGASKFLDLGNMTGNLGETAISKLRDAGFDEMAKGLDQAFGIDSTFSPGSKAGEAFLEYGKSDMGIPEFADTSGVTGTPAPPATQAGPQMSGEFVQAVDPISGMITGLEGAANIGGIGQGGLTQAGTLVEMGGIGPGFGTSAAAAPTAVAPGAVSATLPTSVGTSMGGTGLLPSVSIGPAAAPVAAPAGIAGGLVSGLSGGAGGIGMGGLTSGGTLVELGGLGALGAGAAGAASTAAAATAAANLSMGIGGAMTGGSLAGAGAITGMAGLLGPAAVIAIPLIAMMMRDDDPTADARSAQMIENDLQRLAKTTGADKEAGLIDLEEKIYNNPNYLALMNKAAFNPDLPFGTKATSGGTGVIELSKNMKTVVAENQERFQKVIKEKKKAYEQVGGDQGAAPPPSPYRPVEKIFDPDTAAWVAPGKKKIETDPGAIAGGGQ